ncbi:tetratricopeptide repeat protein [Streptococcus gallolyticus]|uniref:Tetratricopeptide repeat family protein n=1 Tax=Streptococcus gallolyticus TaxID=315405 RepID=A0A060RG23_9STRE|nr:CDC27 family protein [Streptococcus gallolyticus]MCY7172346.1 tetratricopeptide repeat protein [Streptococcus gallolyticus subsp. gallolyticus]MCY7187576.1 tetratricopeptide repeat protein [Streptococcus gallolyticus subsp. gallolyticus]CDO17366.1 Tetratricopeptide repeat family protein [Streptococcus gallolyticus]SDJ64623.1 Anaphase-promoting complex, cyclosome, subunit 3 [Streptococcus gallolyticus]SDL13523.1 Anaphase-promoting complex, cyclosome, subunit 3 [Streptococcus gallolyticus]
MLNSEKMVASIQNQDLEHADKYFKRALKEDDAETLLELAEYLESIGFLPQAREIYLQEREDYPEVNINLAQIATEDGDIEEAFLYLDAISPENEAYLSALLVMADIYDMEGLTDVAREKLLLASEISDEPLVIFGLAEIELELGNFNQAIKEYAKLDNREILELTGISTYQRIGRAYASLGKFEAAIEFLEKAIEIEYDDGTIFELATILYDQGEYQRANVYFKQLDTMNPDFEGYEYVYAQSLHEENKTEEALRLVQKGLSKNEFDTNLLLAASQLSYELHDSKQAESYLLKAKDVAVDDEDVLMRLTNLYLEEERYEDVVALSRDNIDSVLTKWNIAKAYQALEADKKALKLYDELATDLADNPEFLQDYAYILREFGQKERAHQVAERYLQLVPDDVNMVEFLNENEF